MFWASAWPPTSALGPKLKAGALSGLLLPCLGSGHGLDAKLQGQGCSVWPERCMCWTSEVTWTAGCLSVAKTGLSGNGVLGGEHVLQKWGPFRVRR